MARAMRYTGSDVTLHGEEFAASTLAQREIYLPALLRHRHRMAGMAMRSVVGRDARGLARRLGPSAHRLQRPGACEPRGLCAAAAIQRRDRPPGRAPLRSRPRIALALHE